MRKLALAALGPAMALLAILVFPLASQGAAAPRPSPWVGTWELDAARSKVAPNRPTGLTLQFTQADAALIKYSFSFTTAQGQVVTSTYAGKPDGKLHPVTVDGQQVTQVSYTWASPRVLRGQVSGQGGTQEELVLEMAADGKSINEVRRMKAPTVSEETLVFRKRA